MKLRFLTLFFTLFISCIFAQVSFGQVKLTNLPKACLPEEGRMLKDRNKPCHCPPQSYCSQTVTYKGQTVKKLPSHIQEICCDPPPPVYTDTGTDPSAPTGGTILTGPIAGTIGANNNECDVHYFAHKNTACAERTTFGPRTARFCSQYTTTDPAYTADIATVNTCLATCTPRHRDVLNYGSAYLRPGYREDQKEREMYEEVGHDRYSWYAKCRYECFSKNNLLNLLNQAEIDLIDWSRYRYRAPIDKSDYEAVAKMLTMQQLSTTNQMNFKMFWNNTMPASVLGYPFQNRVTVSQTETRLGDPNYVNERIDPNQHDFFRFAYQKGFKNLADFTKVKGSLPGMQLAPASISCVANEDVNLCMTSFINDNTCLSCLDKQTLITLSDGTSKPIKDIKIGDIIKSADNHHAKVTNVIEKNWDSLTFYNINNGDLKITADHPIMTKKGWRAIKFDANDNSHKRYGLTNIASLQIGDVIITKTGEITVDSIIPQDPIKNGISYNLVLEKPHKSFYANGILVKSHN